MFRRLLSRNNMTPTRLNKSVGGLSGIALAASLYGFGTVLASPMDLHFANQDELDAYIRKHGILITQSPDTAIYYLHRADALFLNHRFDDAVDDYSTAIKLDDKLDEAYLGRGLALARAGWLEDSIGDLDIYIARNPESSLAYTKRGIRYLWLGEQDKVSADLEKAIQFDPANAEAHDDLGVIFARKKLYYEAADHFLTTIELDPTYQKAYHNLALISYLTGKDALALKFVKDSLKLAPESRDSWLLKSHILSAMGLEDEASRAREEAEFLPIGNWSENIPLE